MGRRFETAMRIAIAALPAAVELSRDGVTVRAQKLPGHNDPHRRDVEVEREASAEAIDNRRHRPDVRHRDVEAEREASAEAIESQPVS